MTHDRRRSRRRPRPPSRPGGTPRDRRYSVRCMSGDPTVTDPDKYKVVFENDRVRVLEYKDRPGDRTSPHRHPDSVMYALSSFERRLVQGDREVDVQLEAGMVRFLAAQVHHGENIGATASHALFVEPKDPPPDGAIQTGSQLEPEGV